MKPYSSSAETIEIKLSVIWVRRYILSIFTSGGFALSWKSTRHLSRYKRIRPTTDNIARNVVETQSWIVSKTYKAHVGGSEIWILAIQRPHHLMFMHRINNFRIFMNFIKFSGYLLLAIYAHVIEGLFVSEVLSPLLLVIPILLFSLMQNLHFLKFELIFNLDVVSAAVRMVFEAFDRATIVCAIFGFKCAALDLGNFERFVEVINLCKISRWCFNGQVTKIIVDAQLSRCAPQPFLGPVIIHFFLLGHSRTLTHFLLDVSLIEFLNLGGHTYEILNTILATLKMIHMKLLIFGPPFYAILFRVLDFSGTLHHFAEHLHANFILRLLKLLLFFILLRWTQ